MGVVKQHEKKMNAIHLLGFNDPGFQNWLTARGHLSEHKTTPSSVSSSSSSSSKSSETLGGGGGPYGISQNHRHWPQQQQQQTWPSDWQTNQVETMRPSPFLPPSQQDQYQQYSQDHSKMGGETTRIGDGASHTTTTTTITTATQGQKISCAVMDALTGHIWKQRFTTTTTHPRDAKNHITLVLQHDTLVGLVNRNVFFMFHSAFDVQNTREINTHAYQVVQNPTYPLPNSFKIPTQEYQIRVLLNLQRQVGEPIFVPESLQPLYRHAHQTNRTGVLVQMRKSPMSVPKREAALWISNGRCVGILDNRMNYRPLSSAILAHNIPSTCQLLLVEIPQQANINLASITTSRWPHRLESGELSKLFKRYCL